MFFISTQVFKRKPLPFQLFIFFKLHIVLSLMTYIFFGVACFFLSIFQFQTLLRHNTQMVFFLWWWSCSFLFHCLLSEYWRNSPSLNFFFPLPKVAVRSSFLKWNSHTYIFLFGFFTSKGYAPPFRRTCFKTLSHFFLRSSLNPKMAGGRGGQFEPPSLPLWVF